jgi:hypothetical protein
MKRAATRRLQGLGGRAAGVADGTLRWTTMTKSRSALLHSSAVAREAAAEEPLLDRFTTHSTRTRVTSQLWERRMKAEEEQLKRFEVATDATGHGLEGTERPSFLIDKTPCDSAIGIAPLFIYILLNNIK